MKELQPDCIDFSMSAMLGTLGMAGMLGMPLSVSGMLLSMDSIAAYAEPC